MSPFVTPTPTVPYGANAFGAHLVDFVEALRRRGIGVGPSETVDAGRVLSVLDLLDREAVREGLACSLLRRPGHRETFDALFDLWFPSGIGASADEQTEKVMPRRHDGTVDLDALRDLIAELLADGSAEAMSLVEALIRGIVEELGQYRTGTGSSFSAYQALREVDPETITSKLIEGLLGRSSGGGRSDSGDYASEVATRAAATRISDFEKSVARETRRRSAEVLGRDRVATYGAPKLIEEVDFLRANNAELTALRRNVVPLARLLATRLAARRRRARAGSVDLRRTLRKSMSTGGIAIDLVMRKPRAARPELVVLCDISGSVAGFSQFTLLLVHTLREQFSRVRVFAFVDTTDEVTRFFDSGDDLASSTARMIEESDVISYDGHSDYGNSFAVFADKHLSAVTSRASLLVLGDGRTNYREPRVSDLARMVTVARHAYWLNPEPKGQWGTGDSAAHLYSEVIPMHECRSAQQLADVVARLLPT